MSIDDDDDDVGQATILGYAQLGIEQNEVKEPPPADEGATLFGIPRKKLQTSPAEDGDATELVSFDDATKAQSLLSGLKAETSDPSWADDDGGATIVASPLFKPHSTAAKPEDDSAADDDPHTQLWDPGVNGAGVISKAGVIKKKVVPPKLKFQGMGGAGAKTGGAEARDNLFGHGDTPPHSPSNGQAGNGRSGGSPQAASGGSPRTKFSVPHKAAPTSKADVSSEGDDFEFAETGIASPDLLERVNQANKFAASKPKLTHPENEIVTDGSKPKPPSANLFETPMSGSRANDVFPAADASVPDVGVGFAKTDPPKPSPAVKPAPVAPPEPATPAGKLEVPKPQPSSTPQPKPQPQPPAQPQPQFQPEALVDSTQGGSQEIQFQEDLGAAPNSLERVLQAILGAVGSAIMVWSCALGFQLTEILSKAKEEKSLLVLVLAFVFAGVVGVVGFGVSIWPKLTTPVRSMLFFAIGILGFIALAATFGIPALLGASVTVPTKVLGFLGMGALVIIVAGAFPKFVE
jgi:hypothetical protein